MTLRRTSGLALMPLFSVSSTSSDLMMIGCQPDYVDFGEVKAMV